MRQMHPINSSRNPTTSGWVIALSILLALGLIVLFALLSLNHTFFNIDYTLPLLAEAGLFDELPVVLIQQLENQFQSLNLSSTFPGFDPSTVLSMSMAVMPDNWLQQQSMIISQSIVGSFTQGSGIDPIVVDITAIKSNLRDGAALPVMRNMLARYPECTDEQLALMLTSIGQFSEQSILCSPPAYLDAITDQALLLASTILADRLPDQLYFALTPHFSTMPAVSLMTGIEIYRGVNLFRKILPWICLGLAILIVLLTVKNVRLMMTSLGIPLLIAGVITGLFGIWAVLQGGVDLQVILLQVLPDWMHGLTGILNSVFQQSLRATGRFTLILSLAMLLSGLLFILINFLLKRE